MPFRNLYVAYALRQTLGRAPVFRSLLVAALFLTKNAASQLGTGVGSDVATCSGFLPSVAFLDVGFNCRSKSRSRARRLRRGFCSGSSYGFPCRSRGLFEVDGFAICMVGDTDLPACKCRHRGDLSSGRAKCRSVFVCEIQMRFRIEAMPMHTKLEPGAHFRLRIEGNIAASRRVGLPPFTIPRNLTIKVLDFALRGSLLPRATTDGPYRNLLIIGYR